MGTIYQASDENIIMWKIVSYIWTNWLKFETW